MDFVRLCTLFTVITISAISEIRAGSRRQKKDDKILRRLELLTIRVETIELGLRQEKHRSESLRQELNKLQISSDERLKSRQDAEELPGAIVKTLSDLARKTFRVDLEVLKTGMIAEKQRGVRMEKAVQFCKMTLKSQSSRLDTIDRGLGKLVGSIANLNTTVMAVNKSCSQCSAHASGTGADFTSGKCPLSEHLIINKQTLGDMNLGPAVCTSQNFGYALYVIVNKIIVSPASGPHPAEVTIVDMVKIGGGYIRGTTNASVSLSRDCTWPNLEDRGHYLILTVKAPKAEGQGSTLSLKNSVIVRLMSDGPPISRYSAKLLYDLRRRNWNQLCKSRN